MRGLTVTLSKTWVNDGVTREPGVESSRHSDIRWVMGGPLVHEHNVACNSRDALQWRHLHVCMAAEYV